MAEIKRENDSYRGNEYSSYDEYKNFPAEDFKSSEIVKQKMEVYQSEEVKKISFIDTVKEKAKKKNKDKIKDKLKNLNSSTNTLKVTSSIGSAATTVITGIVGATVVLGPTLGITNDEKPKINHYENFAVTKYRVDKEFNNENNELLNDIYVYFDTSNWDTNYGVRLKDPTKNELYYIKLDLGTGFLKIDDAPNGNYSLEIELIDNKYSLVLEILNFTIQTDSKIPIIEDTYVPNELITYNSDGTSNFYIKSNIEELNDIEYLKEYKVLNENGELLDYESTILDGETFEILNIQEKKYSIEERIYSKEGLGEYLIYKNSTDLFDLTANELTINSTQSKAKINIFDEVVSDIDVIVTFNDRNEEQILKFPKESSLEEIVIEFEEPSEDVEINVSYKKQSHSTFDEISFEYKGENNLFVREVQNFKFTLQSEIEVKKVEFCSENVGGSSYVQIDLGGYLIANEFAAIEIHDSSGNLLSSIGYIEKLPKSLNIYDLLIGQELTLTYMTYYEEVQNPAYYPGNTGTIPYDSSYATNTFVDTMTFTLQPNETFDFLVENGLVSYTPIEGYTYYITVNEDNTLNAYADLGLVNNSSENVYIQAKIYNSYEEKVIKSVTSYDGLIEFSHFGKTEDRSLAYDIHYDLLIDVGNISYKLMETQVINGLGSITNGIYNLPFYYSSEQVEGTNNYVISTNLHILSDITVSLLVDWETEIEPYVINLSSISNTENAELIFDLSSYSSNYVITVDCEMEIELNTWMLDASFIEKMNVQGKTEVKAHFSVEIYL